ncbi:hypothetical protein CCR75_007307 [Bremia lactucae]|uniref:GOLD domain-containing protein n=1 Tax=Bremia lactucae TaxID=4779 RepID=A0A976ICW9_BRELC|nr:hypothetical protein CCR75_007307 [Bremia lactucae]
MTLDLAVEAPCSPSLNAVSFVLLHHDGHFRLVRRTLRDFQYLAGQLQLESRTNGTSDSFSSLLSAIGAYCDDKPSFYPSKQLGIRLAFVLEGFLRSLMADCEIYSLSGAVKTFFNANFLTSHKSYRDVVENQISAAGEELLTEKVTPGCMLEHPVAVDENQLVVWKFTSQGTGIEFSAAFKSGDDTLIHTDPFSVRDNAKLDFREAITEVFYYRTLCEFMTENEEKGFVYGHFVTRKRGVVTLEWENVDTSSVISKPLQFQVKVLPLFHAAEVLDVASELNRVNTVEWLHHFVSASDVTSLSEILDWQDDENEATLNKVNNLSDENLEKTMQVETATLEEQTSQLEAQVMHLEASLTLTKKELKSALDRVQISDEIYKANLEAITQLQCDSVASKVSKSSARTPRAANLEMPPERQLSTELEQAQRLCASFQEQCLWRSVKNMELEGHLAAIQIEAASWREKYAQQSAKLTELEKQNSTLRAHKTMLVQEVKRLQPYSQVNLAALVQEAQEARMMQRSLQAKVATYKQLHPAIGKTTAETSASGFVLVEASDEEA